MTDRRRPAPGGRDRKQRGSYERHDAYYHKAREQGFAARSVFKLDEIQARTRVIQPGARVLDLGCAPGAWLQLASRAICPHGRVVGVDLEPVTLSLGPTVITLQADVFTVDPARLREAAGGAFDVVLSDLAPHTTGIKGVDQARSMSLVERALSLASLLLSTGGGVVAKIFDGGDVPHLILGLQKDFAQVRQIRPRATRTHSKEVYIVATGWRGAQVASKNEDNT
ncbi:MAG: RlmE family RNA methyltransferase [Pseudomonadota bacterium]